MKHYIFFSLVFLVNCDSIRPEPTDSALPKIQIAFSPNGGCQDQRVKAIAKAKTSIFVQAYSFTSVPIGEALIERKEYGINVQVILDRSNESEKGNSLLPLMVEHQIPVYIDSAHPIAHNKLIIIDGDVSLTGSANLTKAAENSNAENCVLIRDEKINVIYKANWNLHKEHSKLY